MPLFVFTGRDRPGATALRAATRDTHLAYLRGLGEAVKLGGALLDGDGAPVGSMLVIDAADADAAATLMAADPYAEAGLFASTEILPYRVAVGGFP